MNRKGTRARIRMSVSVIVIMAVCAGAAFGEEKIRVAGSGSMISLFNELAKAYMAENKNVV